MTPFFNKRQKGSELENSSGSRGSEKQSGNCTRVRNIQFNGSQMGKPTAYAV